MHSKFFSSLATGGVRRENSMAKPVPVGIIISFLVLLLLPSVPAHASPIATGTDTVTMLNPPTYIACCDAWQLNYKNNLDSAVEGIVFAVVHNRAGQTVFYQTATIRPGPGQNVTTYFALYQGLSGGSYNASFFVITPSGVAVSSTTTMCFMPDLPFYCP